MSDTVSPTPNRPESSNTPSDSLKRRHKAHKTHKPALSAREVRFCVGYTDHGNITRAHKDAGFEALTDNAHAVAGRKLLRKAQIRKYIRELQTESLDTARVTSNRIVQGLARIAFANRADLFDRRGCLLPKDQWPADVAGTVEAIENEEVFEVVSEPGQPKRKELRGHARKVKTASRLGALKMLAEYKRIIGTDAALEEMAAEIAALRKLLEEVTGAQS